MDRCFIAGAIGSVDSELVQRKLDSFSDLDRRPTYLTKERVMTNKDRPKKERSKAYTWKINNSDFENMDISSQKM